jgi:alpha-N-acetylglucosaminidase
MMMRPNAWAALAASIPLFLLACSTARADAPAALALIARVLPAHTADFTCETIPQDNGRDVFEVDARDGKVVLRGNDGVSQAMAFDWYLRYDAHASYDWQAAGPLEIAGPLPPPTKVRHACAARERFFLNYCTYGYTFPFTDFAGWQRFIDWMAMNGVNRPLLQCGQEATWLRVWRSCGLSDDQVRAYFTGPAHLAWNRMANIDKWGGPLPMSYVDGQAQLQRQLLAAARALGMRPILGGFGGHVPEALRTVRPDAKITHIKGNWGGFADEWTTWFLDPTDPLFKDVQRRFLDEQTAMYGTDHLYAADPFNEIVPPSWDGKYLGGVAKSIIDGMTAEDPKAVWYQMAWTFFYMPNWLKPTPDGSTPFAGMCAGVPPGRMVFLDYFCEHREIYPSTADFHGHEFLWNYLGNFGGNVYMAAPLASIDGRIAKALAVPNCVGVGSTLEGLNINPVAYELTLEQPWHDGATVDLPKWIADYGARRGGGDAAATRAWQTLANDVFELKGKSGTDLLNSDNKGSAVTEMPRYTAAKAPPSPAGTVEPPARDRRLTAGLAAAATELFKASPAAQATDAYRYDAVNIVRQLMAYQSDNLRGRMMSAYWRHDVADFRTQSAQLLDDIRDMDALLATRHEYLLGSWIADARRWGASPAEADYYERNARQILTTWGGPGARLTDYTRREWNGLLRTYYLRRWEEFVRRLDTSLVDGKPFDFPAYARWRVGFDGQWVDAKGGDFAAEPHGDPVATARAMLEKYRPR